MEIYYLEPFGSEPIVGQERQVEIGPFALRRYAVGPEEVAAEASRLKARTEHAHVRPLARSIEALHQVGALWSDPTYPLRQEAMKVLPYLTNLSPEVVEHELDEMCVLLHRKMLVKWIERELGDFDIMESWIEGDGFLVHRQPRGLVFHNLSGNAFLLPTVCIIFGLLTKNTTLLKLPTAEPYFGIRFAESLRDVNPEVASDVAVLYWSARDQACYEALFGHQLDAVVAWGDLRTVRAVSAYAGKYRTRFIDHGARFGIAVMDRITHQELPRVVRALAEDIVPWESYACIAPSFVFVVDGEVTALEFAEALLSAMEALCAESDQRPSSARAATVIANREYYFFHLEAEGRGKVLAPATTRSTVVYSEAMPTLEDFQLCSGRFVMVYRLPELESLYTALMDNGLGGYLQTVAFHGQGVESLDRLTLAGISHITQPGRMNSHQVGHSHDGVFNLQELTTLVTRSRT
jgi:hypothetical protein